MPVKKMSDGFSNTRPERPALENKESDKQPLRVLVDWLQVTFQYDGTYEEVIEFIGLANKKFTYFDYARDTFSEMMKFSNITIMRKGQMTYRLVLTGQGCREYESLSTLNWIELIDKLKGCLGCRFTRVDIAIDDFNKVYTVEMVRQATLEQAVVTRLAEFDDHKKGKISTGELTMDSFYLGALQSRISINFYDKKLERENFGKKELEVTVDTWTRTEIRCKREYADDLTSLMLLNEEKLGLVAIAILKKYVRFVELTGLKHKRREKTIDWWARFTAGVEKVGFSLQAPDKTVEKTKEWHRKSVAPSLAMIAKSFPNMIEFYAYIEELVELGNDRLTEEHEMMIEQSKELRFKEVANKKAKAGIGDNEEESYYIAALKREWEESGKGQNRAIKKTYSCNRIGIVKPYKQIVN